MDKKTCRKCGALKPIDCFYKHSGMADGHLNQCKQCKRAYQRRYAKTPAGKASERRRNRKPKRRERLRKTVEKWERKNPEKKKAHTSLNNAVRDGRLHKPDSCENCGKSDTVIHGHHHDYSKPLDVEWLCVDCHGAHNPKAVQQFSIFGLV